MMMFQISPLTRLPLLAAIALMLSTPAHAHEFKAGHLTIDHPWTRATPAGAKTAGGYVKITNHGKKPDRLIGGSAEGAGKVEVHEMKVENNIMKMRELRGGLVIEPGKTVELKPGSFHLMMMGLKAPYKKDHPIKGTLHFEKAGKVEVTFKVEAMGAKMTHGDDHKMSGHKMDGHDGGAHAMEGHKKGHH